jgi:hypothetical protein
MKNINIILNIIKKVLKFLVILFLVLLVLLTLFFIFFYNYGVYVDRCLDLDGAWNYELNTCDGSPAYDEWYKKWEGFSFNHLFRFLKFIWYFLTETWEIFTG